ncbi:hypothetical protein ACRCJ1_12215, partial [Aerococcus sp. L_4]
YAILKKDHKSFWSRLNRIGLLTDQINLYWLNFNTKNESKGFFVIHKKTTYRWEAVGGLLYNLSFGRRKIYEEKFLYWVCLYNSVYL